MPHKVSEVPEDLRRLNLSPRQIERILLIRATAKKISDRFADLTDFVSEDSLLTAMMSSDGDIQRLHKLLEELEKKK